jgi:hypothetical protein
MGVARAEVDENELLHPLATGAEAYYRYATGDSVGIRLPDGRRIALRELRITARKANWRAFVGSFWFDVERGSLVRAAYRMSQDLDIWEIANEDERRELDSLRVALRGDDSPAARERLREAERKYEEDKVPGWVSGAFRPAKARISAITVEYGLHEGRFWLPRRNVAEGLGEFAFVRVPVKFEESFRYEGVNATPPRGAAAVAELPPVPTPPADPAQLRTAVDSALAFAPPDTARGISYININIGSGSGRGNVWDQPVGSPARTAHVDSLLRRYAVRADSLTRRADSLQAAGDTLQARTTRSRAVGQRRQAASLARRELQCARGGIYDAGATTRHEGTLRVAVRMPCDAASLATSPDLPKSIYDRNEQLFSGADRDALLETLDDFRLQPQWGPQPPRVRSGVDLLRFNRIEGLSAGVQATSELGLGYTASAVARIGFGDWMPNGELGIARTNGRSERRLAVFHRLAVANDDWGSPLSFGASLASALYGRDEGFYYRSWGAELAGTREATFGGARLGWRAFAERHRDARRELRGVLLGPDFVENVDAANVTSLGVGGDLARSVGLDPDGWRLATRLRGEGAGLSSRRAVTGDPSASGWTGYGRLSGEATVTRGLGPLAAAVTAGAGAIGGDAPAQRLFYVGGLHTVRGQFAAPTNLERGVAAGFVGNAYWLARSELGLNRMAVRPSVYYDLGWAGAREDWGRAGRPISGAGVGMSFLDGFVRADLSRGIWPEKRTRFDLQMQARF